MNAQKPVCTPLVTEAGICHISFQLNRFHNRLCTTKSMVEPAPKTWGTEVQNDLFSTGGGLPVIAEAAVTGPSRFYAPVQGWE